jgi:photosystem II stability/assembly factor-like uncharacterized protein
MIDFQLFTVIKKLNTFGKLLIQINTKLIMQKLSFTFLFLLSFCCATAQMWQPLVSGTNRNLHDICIAGNNTVYAATSCFYGDNDFMMGGDILLRSFDNGNTWDSVQTTMYAKDIYFLNDSVGLVSGGVPSCGMAANVLKTNAKGADWNGFQNPSTWNIPWSVGMGYSAAYFWAQNEGYIFGGNWGAKQYKTIDNGANWLEINSFHANNSYPDVFFFNQMNGFLVCDSVNYVYDSLGQISHIENFGYIYKTTDGGLNWNMQTFPNDSLIDVNFPSANVGYVTAGAHLLKTVDGGTTWNSLNVPFSAQKVAFVNDDFGYIVAKDGNIYKTTDGGLNWILSYSGDFLAIEVKKGIGFAVGKNGSIVRFGVGTNAIEDKNIVSPFQISPNPSSSFINIVAPQNIAFSAELFNSAGQLILKEKGVNSLNINLKSFPNEIYFLSIKDENGKVLQTQKVVKN